MKLFKKAKQREERYWKLPATERLHYDSSEERIWKSLFPFFMYTKLLFFTLILAFGLLSLVAISHNVFYELLNRLAPVAIHIARLFAVVIAVDIIATLIFNPVIYIVSRKRLNKRFKLE